MNLNFSAFDTALNRLGQNITANAHGARSHLSQLADLQAELDRLKVEAKTLLYQERLKNG